MKGSSQNFLRALENAQNSTTNNIPILLNSKIAASDFPIRPAPINATEIFGRLKALHTQSTVIFSAIAARRRSSSTVASG